MCHCVILKRLLFMCGFCFCYCSCCCSSRYVVSVVVVVARLTFSVSYQTEKAKPIYLNVGLLYDSGYPFLWWKFLPSISLKINSWKVKQEINDDDDTRRVNSDHSGPWNYRGVTFHQKTINRHTMEPLVERDEGLQLPNSQTNLVIVHHELSPLAFHKSQQLTNWDNMSLYLTLIRAQSIDG